LFIIFTVRNVMLRCVPSLPVDITIYKYTIYSWKNNAALMSRELGSKQIGCNLDPCGIYWRIISVQSRKKHIAIYRYNNGTYYTVIFNNLINVEHCYKLISGRNVWKTLVIWLMNNILIYSILDLLICRVSINLIDLHYDSYHFVKLYRSGCNNNPPINTIGKLRPSILWNVTYLP